MKKNKNMKLVSPILMWFIVLIGILAVFYFFPKEILFSRNYFAIGLAIILIFYWIFMFSWSIMYHKEAPLSTFKISKLIEDGPYKIVRHPIYSADIILGIGIFLLFPSLRILFSLLWLIIILAIWMKLEENSLIVKFSTEYKIYMKKTPMFIPNFKMKGGS